MCGHERYQIAEIGNDWKETQTVGFVIHDMARVSPLIDCLNYGKMYPTKSFKPFVDPKTVVATIILGGRRRFGPTAVYHRPINSCSISTPVSNREAGRQIMHAREVQALYVCISKHQMIQKTSGFLDL